MVERLSILVIGYQGGVDIWGNIIIASWFAKELLATVEGKVFDACRLTLYSQQSYFLTT